MDEMLIWVAIDFEDIQKNQFHGQFHFGALYTFLNCH